MVPDIPVLEHSILQSIRFQVFKTTSYDLIIEVFTVFKETVANAKSDEL